MTDGRAEKAIDQLLAAINQGKDPPPRHRPGGVLGFPDLDVFTPEALDRIKALAGGDPARTARLSARVLEIAQRECAVPVLPDLVDDAAAQIDLERADSREEGAQPRPHPEHSAPRTDTLPQGISLSEPSARPRQEPDPETGRAAPGVSAPRRMARRAAGVFGVLLVAAGVVGYLAYSSRLDTLGLGDPREIVISSLAAIGVAPSDGQQQEGESGDTEASLPAERTAESEPPTGSSGEAAVAEDDSRDETPNETVAAGHPLREEDRRADEAALAERWPELKEAAENAIRQRFYAAREQAEQARQALEAVGSEMEQLHRRQREEMQVRHARELALAGAEGADAMAQAKDRHQQEQAALQRDQNAERERLAAAQDELDRQLQDARRDIGPARREAIADSEGGEGEGIDWLAISSSDLHEQLNARMASPPAAAALPEDLTTADPVAAESELQPQSGEVDDRQQQTLVDSETPGEEAGAVSGADPGEEGGETAGEDPGMVVVAPGQMEPLELPQDEVSEPVAVPMTTAPQGTEVPENDEEATPLAGQPLLPTMPSSPPAEPAPGAADGAAGTAETAAAEAAIAPEGKAATESHPAAVPAGQDVADLVNRGNALLDLGDLASARLFYRLAADRGSPEGAMLMGMTFDPVYFARTGIRGTRPQIQDALDWYGKAVAMGSQPAERRMGELRSWLEQSAAAGDAQAKAALQQLR